MQKLGLLILLFSLGCGKPMTTSVSDFDIPEPRFKMQPLKTDTSNFLPLAWDNSKKVKTGKQWSQMIYSIVENEEPALLESNPARDIENFCPAFNALSVPQRLNFWGQFFAAVALRESSWNPLSQMVEPNARKADPVTQRPVKSEGLLQLSYQDEQSRRLDCGFNWTIDRHLNENDGRRTILHPFLNLRCGIKIFAQQLKKRHLIELETGVYWQVLKKGNDSLQKIQAITNSFELCRK